MINKMKLLLASLIAASSIFAVTAAHAAKPVVQACIGKTISAIAHQPPSDSNLAADLAHANGGLGSVIQAAQAGLIPDSQIPNTCND